MANNYNGEVPFDIADTPFKDYTPADWAMHYIAAYGSIDGSHHKDWVLDQVARILKGTPVLVTQASWDSGADLQIEWRFETGESSDEYKHWVIDMLGAWDAENEEFEYSYDTGIAP